MGRAGEREKRRQLGFVLAARIRIVVAEVEFPHQRSVSYRSVSSAVSDDAKKRKHWQGLTVGGIGPDEYGKLYARSYEAAVRKRARAARTRDFAIGVIDGDDDRTLAADRPQRGEAATIS